MDREEGRPERSALWKLADSTFHTAWAELRLDQQARLMLSGFSLDPLLMAIEAAQQETQQLRKALESIAAMLGWENVPPLHILEKDIAALKARALAAAAREPQAVKEMK